MMNAAVDTEVEIMTDFQYKSMLRMFLSILKTTGFDGMKAREEVLNLFPDDEREDEERKYKPEM